MQNTWLENNKRKLKRKDRKESIRQPDRAAVSDLRREGRRRPVRRTGQGRVEESVREASGKALRQ